MKIEQIHIEGYGHFGGTELSLSPSLTLVHGENEAGKSTLLSFIRAVLFGFPSRKSAERYEVASGPFGGELSVLTAQGPLTVRRMGGKKSEGDLSLKGLHGAPEPLSRLEQALHGVSRELFCQVFAFSLSELSTFEDLARQGTVTEALFAAGMHGARRLPEVTSALRKRSEELFGKTAHSKRPLNLVLARLEEVRGELEALGDRPARYFELQKTLTGLDEEVKALQEQVRILRKDRERLAALHQVIPDLLAVERLRAEWAELPAGLEAFPQDGLARLEAAQQRRRTALARHSELALELERANGERTQLESALLSEGLATALRSAESAFSGRQEIWRSLPRRRAELAARRKQEQDRVLGFGLSLDEAGLLSLDVGGAARSELAALAGAVDRAAREVSDREAELRQAQSREEDAKSEHSRRAEEAARLCEAPVPELRRRLSALQRLPVLQNELRRCEEDHQARLREQEDLRSAKEELPEASVPAWWPMGAAVLGVALVVAAAVFSGGSAAWVAGLVAAALVGAVVVLWRKSESAHQKQVRTHQERAARQQAQLTRLAEAVARLGERLAALTAEDRELRASVGAVGDLRGEAERTEQSIREAERRAQLERELEAAKERNQRLAREVEIARSRQADAEKEAEKAHENLKAFVAARGLPARVGAEGAASLFADLAQAQSAVRSLKADETALRVEAEQCERAANALIQAAREAGLRSEDPEQACVEARSWLERRAVEVQRIAATRSRIEDLTGQLHRVEGERAEAESSISSLFERGGVQDEEAFRARAQQSVLRLRLSGELRTHRAAVEASTQLSAEQAAQALFAQGGAEAVASKLEELSKELESATTRQAETVERRGSAQNELSALETDGAVAKLRVEEEELIRKAAVMARQYARDRLGLVLLTQARKRFEEEQQPQVVKRASQHFAQLTGFRYGRVFVPAAEATELRVIDAQNDERSAEQLSRGTREQLYLAFRLAVIEDFAEKRGPLPIVLDDILVNFDPGRARNAVKVLSKIAEKNQVIAFTCHPWLRELFSQHGAQVVELRSQPAQLPMLAQRS